MKGDESHRTLLQEKGLPLSDLVISFLQKEDPWGNSSHMFLALDLGI
jgi:hypothetical protein